MRPIYNYHIKLIPEYKEANTMILSFDYFFQLEEDKMKNSILGVRDTYFFGSSRGT